MGLLSEGSPLDWEETKKYADHVRKHGVKQFINLFHKLKNRPCDVLKWGDEVEYMLIKLDDNNKKAAALLKASDLLPVLQKEENENPSENPTAWRPEYAAYMIEGTPGKPYGGLFAHFNVVEANMKLRREELQKLLDRANGETCLSLTSYPRLGCPNFSIPPLEPNPTDTGVSKSLFFPDDAIFSSHPRFRTLTKNIRSRRGEKVSINIPVFKDKNTQTPFVEKFPNDYDGEGARAAKPDHIYMDAMGFGMGSSCLQLTFQACCMDEAKFLYDQLTPMCPILLALTASAPIYRGLLSDVDCRWYVISSSVDCRTKEERGEEPLKNNRFRIPKSRYDSVDSYLSPDNAKFNDVHLVMDEELCQEMIDGGVDVQLARHVAHLFIRDPVSLFSEKIHQDDKNDSDHFENIQSTNWQTMRFKPPPVNSDIGWRVEFRPMEVQLTDFENAAFVVFLVLLTRTILTFKLNFVIPISEVDANMHESHKRDAVRNSKFHFRKNIHSKTGDVNDVSSLMDINTIINGGTAEDGTEFPGLIPLINSYMATTEDADVDTRCTISQYFQLLSDRASGRLKTTARWIRDFVDQHPAYKHDSVISEEINYDLMKTCVGITEGKVEGAAGMLNSLESKSADEIPESMKGTTDIQINGSVLNCF